MFLILRGLFPCCWNSEALLRSAFPVESTACPFLLPSTVIRFYYTTANCVLVRFGCRSAFYASVTSLSRRFVSDSFPVFLSSYCKFFKLLFELGWIVDFLFEVFLYLGFEQDLPLLSVQKSCRESLDLCSLPVSTADEGSWVVVPIAHLSCLSP